MAATDGWQPMETAPRDGTDILVSNGEWIDVGWFSQSIWLGVDSEQGAFVIDDPRDYPIWGDALGLTHWHPLPPPPDASPAR